MLAQPIKEQKKKIKLSELSDLLKVKKSTIKQWEKDFNLQLTGSLYCEQEITLFKKIKELLHQKGTSLENAKKEIEKFFAATETTPFQPAQSDSEVSMSLKKETLKTEKIIKKDIEESLIFHEKQTFSLEAITDSLQIGTIELPLQTLDAIEKTTIVIEKEQIQETEVPKKICAPAETRINPAFHTTLQTIKSIALEMKEKLQKQATQK